MAFGLALHRDFRVQFLAMAGTGFCQVGNRVAAQDFLAKRVHRFPIVMQQAVQSVPGGLTRLFGTIRLVSSLVHKGHDFHDARLRRVACQKVTPVAPASRSNELSLPKLDENFGYEL